jgi:hypothetical protein
LIFRGHIIFYCFFGESEEFGFAMSTVEEIKQAVKNLPARDRLKVVKWVARLDGDEWDKVISKDAAGGKLDFLVREGKEALKKGRLKPFPPL